MAMERYTFFGFDTIIEVTLPRRYAFLTKEIEHLIAHFDRLWNRFSPESAVWMINHTGSCEVDADTLSILKEAMQLSQDTGGFFCPLVASLLDLWGFSTNPRVPEAQEIRKAVQELSRSYLVIEGQRVSLQGKGQLDLGGIAKGYVVDSLASFLKGKGVHKALINAGGQVFGFGTAWKVGIFNPVTDRVMGYIIIDDMSVSTSGDYFRFFEQEGVRYHHVINPLTGYPGDDFRSVTVVAPRGVLADVLSTAILAGGHEALALVRRNFGDLAILTIDAKGELFVSESMKKSFVFLSPEGVQP
ncbi:MAG: FAD:protein FMN transferase [Atribacterota bacterium]|nr:FAD:protein FMN transferase [Atribacterota bacterium]